MLASVEGPRIEGFITLQVPCPQCKRALLLDVDVDAEPSGLRVQWFVCPVCEKMIERTLLGCLQTVRLASPL